MRQVDTLPAINGLELIREIGSGGMGTVFLAKQASLGREVAVKVLKQQAAGGVQAAERFQREAELLAKVNHPAIVTVHDRLIVDDDHVLVMEYIGGNNLRELMVPGQPLSIAETRRLFREVATAVEHLHEQGIVHRDLKPENVLIDHEGRAKITDFGIAALESDVGALTAPDSFIGTLDYLAPEQRHRLPVDHRADQFSLAVMAYEMLTGEKPLGVFDPPSSLNPQLSADIDAVVMRALIKHPEERFDGVEPFAAALDKALGSIAAPKRRGPSIAAVLVVATVVIGVSIASTSSLGPRELHREGPPHSQPDSRESTGDDTTANPPTVPTNPFDTAEMLAAQQAWTEHLGVPPQQEITLGITMVFVPPGEFIMGTDEEELEAFATGWPQPIQRFVRSEAPRHRVRLTRPYYIAAYEVTVGQFREFVDATGHESNAVTRHGGRGRRAFDQSRDRNWRNPGFDQTDLHPVTQVSWDDATAFCQWLGDQVGQTIRLPSEAEWEYACRAGTQTHWYFGNESPSELMRQHAQMHESDIPHPQPVGLKLPNPLGLFDLYGNVSELCLDGYSDTWYAESPADDPVAPPSNMRVLRGSPYFGSPGISRSAFRSRFGQGNGRSGIGFRIVMEIEEPRAPEE